MVSHTGVRIALFLTLTSLVFGQNSGSITGTVRDTSGGIITGASVVVTSVDKGVSFPAQTNTDGDYLIAGLVAGRYNLSVTQPGFKKFDAQGIVLEVAQKARVDANLQVGETSTEISVQGTSVAQVDTQSAEMSGTVTQKEISQIVLNGRNFSQLVTLVPGVSSQTGQDEGTVGVAGNVSMSINGGRTEDNNWELDGGDNMDNGSNQTLNVYPNADAIAEVKVLTSNYGAQYGRNGSGTIETSIKSGTRDFHGDLFEYVRNNAFNARNFFQSTVPEYKKNDFGYTIGGPVFIPGLYNKERNKTFFFWSEDWRKEIVPGQTFNQQLPSVQEQQGNFSDVCPGAGALVSAASRTAFPDCPISRQTGAYFPNNTVGIDPNAAAILKLLPTPNVGSGTGSYYQAAPAQPTNWREELVRIDHNFNNNVRMFGHFIHDSWNTVEAVPLWGNGASFPTVGTNFVGPTVSLVANVTANLTPTLLNEFTFSYTTDHIFLNATGPAQRPAGMTMTGLYNNGFGGLLPAVTVGGGTNYNTGGFNLDTGYFPWVNSNPTFTYKDQLSKIVGSHNLYFGAYFVAAQKNEENSPYIQGVLNFSQSSPNSTGNAFADLLQGTIASYRQTNAKIKYYNRYKIVEPYVQDDWHVSKHLTVNLGFRLSLFGTYREKYFQVYNFDPSAYSLASAPQLGTVSGQSGALIPGIGNPYDGLVQCGKNGVPRGCMTGHLFNPAPRIGFAYDPLGDGKTAIRGGYGIFFEHTNGNEGNTEGLEGSPPLVQTATQYNIQGYTNIGGGSLLFPLGVRAIPTSIRYPYVQQWNFSIQRELSAATVLTVAYVGSKGTHLGLQSNLNQLYPINQAQNPYAPGQAMTKADCASSTVNGAAPTGAAGNQFSVACGSDPNPYRPYQGFGSIQSIQYVGNSSYNGMQVALKRHVGRLSLDLAYTWSHSLDYASDYANGNFLDSYNRRLNYASSDFDQRHLLNVGYVYDLPLFTKKGLMNTLLGGWQWSGLMTFQTGTPFSVTDALYGPGVGNTLGAGSYLDLVGNPSATSTVNGNVSGVVGPLLYNPAAFRAPQGLTFGTAGRNVLNNPNRTNFDMGLFKHFAIRESQSIEFRAEGFNVFNHTQWLPLGGINASGSNNSTSCFGPGNFSAGDASCLPNNNFLRPGGAHNPRILQLAMKFIF